MADRGIKLAKDGSTIDSTDINDYNLWTKYPPITFLEKKEFDIVIDTSDGCPDLPDFTHSEPYDWDFIPFVIARVQQDGGDEKYDLPVSNFPTTGALCDGDHALNFSLDYTVREDFVDIIYSAYCQALVMGEDNECISTTLTFHVSLYFYMWELGSPWPV